MSDENALATTRTSAVIKAPPEVLYRAFTDPDALAVWQVPGDMTAKVHEFDARIGGGYRMSLFYPTAAPDIEDDPLSDTAELLGKLQRVTLRIRHGS